MKKTITIALALLISATGLFAQTTEKTKSPVRKMEVADFTQLKVDAQIEVLLIDDGQTGTAWLVGEPDHFDDISLKVDHNELVISSRRPQNYKSKITVEVHVKDQSKASLQSTGNIHISREEDVELVFLRRSPGVSVEN